MLCDAFARARRRSRWRRARSCSARSSAPRRAGFDARMGSRARVLPAARRLRGRAARRASATSRTSGATSRTTTCSPSTLRRAGDRRDPPRRRRLGHPRRVLARASGGPGQHEINLRYAPALEMADRHVIYKQAAQGDRGRRRHVAHLHGEVRRAARRQLAARAPLALGREGRAGRSRATTRCRARRCACSPLFRGFLGGLLAHARELALFFAPNPNSYKRYRAGHLRADAASPGATTTARPASASSATGASLRVECRIPGADANPYLAYAALLAAGLDGVERGLEPGPGFRGDVYAVEGAAAGAAAASPRPPPSSRAARSRREAFGADVVEHLLHFARTEERAIATRVSDVERARYFERSSQSARCARLAQLRGEAAESRGVRERELELAEAQRVAGRRARTAVRRPWSARGWPLTLVPFDDPASSTRKPVRAIALHQRVAARDAAVRDHDVVVARASDA